VVEVLRAQKARAQDDRLSDGVIVRAAAFDFAQDKQAAALQKKRPAQKAAATKRRAARFRKRALHNQEQGAAPIGGNSNPRPHTQNRRVGNPCSENGSGVRLEEAAEEGGGVFAEGAVFEAEGGEEVGVDVEFADDFVVDEDGDDDFGFGFEGAGEVAGIGINIIDDDGLAGGGGSAADALVERNAGVGGHGALEGAEDENVVVAFLFEQVEANPVVASKLFVEERDDILHEGFGGIGGFGKGIESRDEVGRFGLGCGHGK